MSAYDYLLDRVRESQERERAAKMEADRCQQLAALEAEIGRAVIEAGVIFHSTSPAIDELIARWRALLGAGAEAATGGEEAR